MKKLARRHRATGERPSKSEREEFKQVLSQWIRFQNLARFYEEELKTRYEMRILPNRPALPLFSLEVDGVPLLELWEKDPDKAWVAATGPTERAEWTESLRNGYLAAQTRLIVSLNCDDREMFSNLLTLYGPRLLAKDPFDAGVVLSTLDILWRDLRKLSKQDREELHSYGITDKDIHETRKRGRKRDREFLYEIGKALANEAERRPELPETEKPESRRRSVSVTNAAQIRLDRYREYKRDGRSAKDAYNLISTTLSKLEIS